MATGHLFSPHLELRERERERDAENYHSLARGINHQARLIVMRGCMMFLMSLKGK